MFDYINYFEELTKSNRLATAEGFHFCTCSGLSHLEGVLAATRTEKALVCASDVCQETTIKRGGAWFKRRVLTLFFLKRYRLQDAASYRAALALCRALLQQYQSRWLHDYEELLRQDVVLQFDDIKSSELGGVFASGFTGLYALFTVDEPIDLTYDETAWL